MRFLSMIRVNENGGQVPSEQLMHDMGKLIDEMTRKGALVRTAGLRPTKEGRRVPSRPAIRRRWSIHRDQGSVGDLRSLRRSRCNGRSNTRSASCGSTATNGISRVQSASTGRTPSSAKPVNDHDALGPIDGDGVAPAGWMTRERLLALIYLRSPASRGSNSTAPSDARLIHRAVARDRLDHSCDSRRCTGPLHPTRLRAFRYRSP
jgi:hypothetical protein